MADGREAQQYAYLRNGEWVLIVGGFCSGEGEDAINHPAGWIEAVSEAEAAEVGAHPVAEGDVPGGDVVVVERHLGDRDARPVWVYVTEPVPNEPATIPQSVTPRQLRLALLGAGKLDQVEAFVASGRAPKAAVISWEYATEFLRSDPMLNQLAAVLQPPLGDAEIDQLFVAAAQIQ